MSARFRHGHEAGLALVLALVFLVVLTLVAASGLRGAATELRLGANTVYRNESFEASEIPRLLVGDLLDAHVFARGWPDTIGGDVPAALFDEPIPSGLTIAKDSGGRPKDWFADNDECATPPCAFDPDRLTTDAEYERLVGDPGTPPMTLRGTVGVFKIRTDLAPGAGAAMVAGYEGTGKGAAAGGGAVYFYIGSTGAGVSGTASSRTGATYRHVVRN